MLATTDADASRASSICGLRGSFRRVLATVPRVGQGERRAVTEPILRGPTRGVTDVLAFTGITDAARRRPPSTWSAVTNQL